MTDGDHDEEAAPRRFSDPELEAFHRDYAATKKENKDAHTALMEAVEANTVEVRNMREEQSGLMQAWSELGVVVKIGVRLGRFAKWLASLSVIVFCVNWLSEHWPH